MKRTLVAVTAAALLLTGCATGDTGHLVPDIEPDLVGPLSAPAAVTGGGSGDEEDEEGQDGSTGDATDLQDAFDESAGSEPWFDDVTEVVLDDDGSVQVTTALTAGGDDAVAVCEAAVAAAESTGVPATSVEVLDAQGAVLSELDAAAGGEGCTS